MLSPETVGSEPSAPIQTCSSTTHTSTGRYTSSRGTARSFKTAGCGRVAWSFVWRCQCDRMMACMISYVSPLCESLLQNPAEIEAFRPTHSVGQRVPSLVFHSQSYYYGSERTESSRCASIHESPWRAESHLQVRYRITRTRRIHFWFPSILSMSWE